MTGHEHIRRRILDRAGVPPFEIAQRGLDELRATQWSPDFERLMRNRLVMGAMRYGLIDAQRQQPNPFLDIPGAIRARLQKYVDTGNTECLVDVANLALLEFEIGRHPKKHFHALHGDHCHKQRA